MNPSRLSASERFLSLFTEVKPDEGSTALMLFANVFLILLAYYLVKPIREGWIAVSDIEGLSKMEVKAYSSFAQSIVLLFVVGWYAKLADRWDRVTLFSRATLFCISNMVIFWFLQPNFFFATLPVTGLVYYIWVGMFGVFVVSQFWTFCADVYDDERGKRMLPFIAVGATSGAAAGSWLVDLLVSSGLIPTEALLLVAIFPLVASIVLVRAVERREDHHGRSADEEYAAGEQEARTAAESTEEKSSIWSGAKLVLVSRFLLLAALVTLFSNWVNTNGENLLFQVVQETLAVQAQDQGITKAGALQEFTRDGTTAFYGNFYFWVNVVAMLLQAFVASRLLKYGGFAAILLDPSRHRPRVLYSHGPFADLGDRQGYENCRERHGLLPEQHLPPRALAPGQLGDEVPGKARHRHPVLPAWRRTRGSDGAGGGAASSPSHRTVLHFEHRPGPLLACGRRAAGGRAPPGV